MTWKPLIYVITPGNDERAVLRAQLLGADYNVAAVHGPVEAAKRLDEGVPHTIIIDHQLVAAEDSGFADLMHKLEEVSPLPLLFLMDPDEESPVPANLREGLDDTLMRPVSSLELLARVGSLLRNRKLLGQVHIQEKFLLEKQLTPYTEGDVLPTVLLVEDEASEMANIGRLLEQIPCKVIQTRTPSDALWHVKQDPPQLVIVDLLFPDLDGLELCRYLKKQEETRYTPLLMLTSVPELDNRIMGMESGPDDYLIKPAQHVEVLTRVRRLLDRNRGHQKLIGNALILNREGYSDPSTGIPRKEFFRFVYPEMVAWSQKAQLPFTVARIRIKTEESFFKIASEIRSILRNFDLDFITGETDLSLILPETPAERAQIALARIMSRAEDMGVPPWEIRLVTVSVGEDGWETEQIRDTLKTKGLDLTNGKVPDHRSGRIVVAGDSQGGEKLAALLNSQGFSKVQVLPMEQGRDPGRIYASLVILQGGLDKIPDLMERLLPSLSSQSTPILVKYRGEEPEIARASLPPSADYIPAGASDDYFFHRVRNSLDVAQLRSGTEEVEEFLKRMVRLLEEGDSDIQGHSQQVSNLSVALGARLGLGNDEIDALRWGSLLHDIGKIFLPGKIITKEGMLSAEEFMVVKSHPRLGHDLCRAFSMLDSSLPVIKHHHERMDGKGYARIVSVVDVHDTLMRRRPYRPAFAPEEASRILDNEAQKGMWDKGIVNEFLRMLGS
jgi:putative two-component system response regulator